MLRTYGRINQTNGVGGTWVVVTTDANGDDDNVWLTTLAQNCRLNLGEDPFWANNGIPAYQSVITQVFPDFYMSQMQQFFAQYFVSLMVTRVTAATIPTYNISATLHNGAIVNTTVAM